MRIASKADRLSHAGAAWSPISLVTRPFRLLLCLVLLLSAMAFAVAVNGYQPDLAIQTTITPVWTGTGIFDVTAAGEVNSVTVDSFTPGVYQIQLTNVSTSADTFVIKGDAGDASWTVKYFDALFNGNDITAAVTSANGWTPAQIGPTGQILFRVEVRAVPGTTVNGAVKTVLVKATSTGDGTKQDAVKAVTTLQEAPVATPTYSPPPGVFTSSPVTVSISCAQLGAVIHYTTDGTTPTAASTTYTIPFNITTNTVVKAIASFAGYADSPVAVGPYWLSIAQPTFAPPPGSYNAATAVTITCPTPSTIIHYTVDGTTPTAASTTYTTPVNIATTSTLKAIATYPGLTDSTVTSGLYTIQAATPTFTPAPNTFTGTVTVTVACTTVGAVIHYTTDGTVPTATSATYAAPLTFTATTTLKAIAVKAGIDDSVVASGTYTIQAAIPTYNPAPGNYPGTVTVTVTCPTPGATIHYTTDGTVPTPTSATYAAPLTFVTTTTLKAIAVVNGMLDSPVATGVYTILAQVDTPAFNPAPGTYIGAVAVSMSCILPGAAIHYTTDGSVPTAASTLYSVPVNLTLNTTLKAIGMLNGHPDSQVAIGNYLVKAVKPTFTPVAGTYTATVTVTLTTVTPGAVIHYTTDGSIPTVNSPAYTIPFTLVQTTTVNAIAVAAGMTTSDVATALYTIQAVAPTFTPAAPLTFSGSTDITIASTTIGATIHYTTDGTAPTPTSTTYTVPVHLTATTTLKAIAVRAGMADSPVTTGLYTLKLATPVLTPVTGTYIGSVLVTITCSTPGATIHYTTDGTAPTLASTTFTAPFPINVTTTVKAAGFLTGSVTSDVASETYTINVIAPVLTPAPGTYAGATAITITSATPGASIHYTVDGSAPTLTSPLYTAPVTLTNQTTLQAYASATGMGDSAVTSGQYTILTATPTFTPAPGTYVGTQTVQLACSTPGSTIYYTIDGSIPTTASTVYITPLQVSKATTVKAIATAPGLPVSPLAIGSYQIQVDTPTFTTSPAAGPFTGPVTVSIATNLGSTIYYTLDGNPPTTKSLVYKSPVLITGSSVTINAYATRIGLLDSSIATVQYVIAPPAVADPSFSPTPASYTGNGAITIVPGTTGSIIHYTYTTDGSTPADPTANSPVYATGLQFNAAVITVKARAFKANMTPSAVVMGIFAMPGDIYEPDGSASLARTISSGQPQQHSIVPQGGQPDEDWVKFTLTAASNARIETSGLQGDTEMWLYGPNNATTQLDYNDDGPVGQFSLINRAGSQALVPGTYYVRVRAYNNYGVIPAYTLTLTTSSAQQVTAPAFTPAPGTYGNSVSVSITNPMPGAWVRYTTNGQNPVSTSALYNPNAPPNLTKTTTLKAACFVNNQLVNSVATGTYTIAPVVAAPMMTPAPGLYVTSVTITLASATKGATIYYTTDGSKPTTNSTVYTGSFTLGVSSSIVQAIAAAPGLLNSVKVQGAYRISAPPTVATPVLTPAPGGYGGSLNVSALCATPGAVIHYTTDGTPPNANSPIFTAPLKLLVTTTVSVIAMKSNMTDSAVATGTYTINPVASAATPVFFPLPGTYSGQVTVTLYTVTAGAAIHYTTDNSDPTLNSPLYTAPFTLTTSTTVKAKAFRIDMKDSALASGDFVIQ